MKSCDQEFHNNFFVHYDCVDGFTSPIGTACQSCCIFIFFIIHYYFTFISFFNIHFHFTFYIFIQSDWFDNKQAPVVTQNAIIVSVITPIALIALCCIAVCCCCCRRGNNNPTIIMTTSPSHQGYAPLPLSQPVVHSQQAYPPQQHHQINM